MGSRGISGARIRQNHGHMTVRMPLGGASQVLASERERGMLIETTRGGPGHEPIWECARKLLESSG